jgi:hypothetical protein
MNLLLERVVSFNRCFFLAYLLESVRRMYDSKRRGENFMKLIRNLIVALVFGFGIEIHASDDKLHKEREKLLKSAARILAGVERRVDALAEKGEEGDQRPMFSWEGPEKLTGFRVFDREGTMKMAQYRTKSKVDFLESKEGR